MNNIDWKNKKVVIVLHQATTGPGHDLRDYLLERKVKELLFIVHPLLYIKDNFKKSSRYELYRNGTLVTEYSAFHYKLPELVLYIKDFTYSIIWTLKIARRHDIYIGLGNLNAIVGVLLKKLTFTKKTIFYVIDYVPKRFQNNILNTLYHYVEKLSAEQSESTWNLSPRMTDAREKKWNKRFPKQIIVPHGVHLSRIKRAPFEKVNKTEILYMGTLLQKQGIQLVLQAMPKILEKIPNVTFTIIGKGPYEGELRKIVKELSLEKNVTFLGYIESHEEMENRIAKAGVTVALYDKENDTFSYFADPGKIKNYLGAGVPVILTDVPYVAKQVADAKCGIIVSYNKETLEKALISFFSNESKMKEYRKNAVSFAKEYEWDFVFDQAFRKL